MTGFTTYRVIFTDEKGEANVEFMEFPSRYIQNIAERHFARRIRKELGGCLLRCDAWFE